ncbi:non-ribosomal peptide synthetase [Nostoc sp. CENA543]|uniref:non-ribosomal peptide synthetase n=1 Tax=Nostoc sp. CENA543 TaxID=1869241 RepID=UPI000CA176E6|nr:non-ribosomal peptide synthetase [Nostoc sp. CENA543]AUT02008.1 non-ribosomal peptide synthetase [Nostoc sp. CENA543]
MKTLEQLLSELRQRDVKLWLEGDRLRYRAAKDSLTPELLAELKAQKSEIINFLRQITTVATANIPPIVPCERNGNLLLSFGQQRLWFLHQFEPDSSSNNMPVVVRFTGNLNVTILEASLKEVVRRHEVLRTTFPAVDGKPVAVVTSEVSLTLPIVDLRQVPEEQREAEAFRLATDEAHRPFDLANGPILRVLLLRLREQEHLLVWNMHAIVCDGASSDVFYQDFTTIYKALAEGKTSPLPPLPVQYADFAHWQHQWLQGEVLQSQVHYWQQKLAGSLPIIQLPYDHPRPSNVQTYRGDRAARLLPKTLNYALTDLSQKWGVTLFMTLLTVFELLLYRYSGQEDLLISFASVGRGQVETERLIGFFSNTLVLRSNLAGNPTFRELLDRVRKDCLEAYAHQDLPFERLIEELKPEQRNRNSSSLFQVKFSLNPPWSNGRGMASVQLPDLNMTSLFGYIYHGKTKYDLILVLREQDNGLGMVFDYNADMFEVSTIERMLGHFQSLLEGIVANPDCPILELPLLTKAEQHQLLVDWNHTKTADIKDIAIHQLFEVQAECTPDRIAAIAQHGQLTYQQLNQRANQLAHYLQTLGVSTGVSVGLYVEPSLEMIVGLLGICKAGGTYVPITPTSPDTAFICQDAQISLLLTTSSLIEQLSECGTKIMCLDTDWSAIAVHNQQNPVTPVTPDHLACITYPPTATARPHGISISHRNLVNHSLAISQTWELSQGDRVLVSSAIDESLFSCWFSGTGAVLQPPSLPNSITQFCSFISQQQITVLNLSTYFWHQLVDHLATSPAVLPDSLRLVMVGGEKVSPTAYQTWVERVGTKIRWLHAYGVKETTFTATVYNPQTSNHKEIPIGKPIANTQIYILDQLLQPVPIGSPGEIYISGVGVVPGYYQQSDLTSQKFIPHPFSDDPQARLYQTGDLGRYLADGNLEYLGRTDRQVKIRGVGIDLTQIESLIGEHSDVTQAVVITNEQIPGEQHLVAYIVSHQEQQPQTSDLRSFLSQKLADEFIPSDFVCLKSLPLTANGQINYRALPEPNFVKQQLEGNFVAPHNETELLLTTIWAKLLGIQGFGINDNFFDLGGNSILAVRLFTEIEQNFGVNFPLSTLLQRPTIAELAAMIRQDESAQEWEHLVIIKPGSSSKPPFFCVNAIWGNILFYRGLASYLSPDQPFYGLQSQGLDGKQTPLSSIPEMAASYIQEMQRVQPQGPYYLGGFSWGGTLALEIAQQLQAQGQEVRLLAIFDTGAPAIAQSQAQMTNVQSTRYRTNLLNFRLWELQDYLSNLREKISWHLRAGKASILYRLYLRYIKRSLPEFYIFNVAAANYKAYKSYFATAYSGKVTLFRAIQDLAQLEKNAELRWDQIATDGVDIYQVMGATHTGLMEDSYVKLLAEQLQLCLERSQQQNRNKMPPLSPLPEDAVLAS